jgi:hypothetical protein
MTKRKNERSLIPVLIVSGVVVAPLIFILGVAVGSQVQVANILTADSLSSWVAALATMAIAILTFVLAKETWYLREAQIEQVDELKRENIRPNVSVTLKSSESELSFMDARIHNQGKGIARNIKFTFIDRDEREIKHSENEVVDEFLKLHIFSDGMHSLGIGQKIESFLFSFFEIKNKIKEPDVFSIYFKIKVSYEDVEGTAYYNELTIDFKEFQGISRTGGGNPIHNIAKDMKKLREQFEKLTRSSQRLNINTYSSEDREQEHSEYEKKYK